MFKGSGGNTAYWPPDKYRALANRFYPQHFDPDKWFSAAARAGFRYAVYLVRHSDGYAMWPSAHGNFSTRTTLGGRDLVKPYVEACRKHGLKVGFYFCPTDWSFAPNGWPWPLDLHGEDMLAHVRKLQPGILRISPSPARATPGTSTSWLPSPSPAPSIRSAKSDPPACCAPANRPPGNRPPARLFSSPLPAACRASTR
jgi:hypothetical protein